MAATLTLDTALPVTDSTQSTQIARGSIALTANYGGASTHGDTLNFSTLYGIQSDYPPVRVFIYEEPAAGTAPTGYFFEYGKGTTNANGVLIVMGATGAAAGDPSSEYTQASAYSAALLAAKLRFEAVFLLGQ